MNGMADIIPPAPRLSATVLLLRDDPMEVLMVRRRAGSVFDSALVFPGGVVEPEDGSDDWSSLVGGADGLTPEQRSLRIAAFRETFEETGVLVLEGGDARSRVGARFKDLVAGSGGRLPLGALVPFGHWITPVVAPRRFDTHFFLCAFPEGEEPRSDNREVVGLEWITPQAAVAQAAAGDTAILFPTLMNLKRLAESTCVEDALAAARARTPVTVLPTVARVAGGSTITIPAEAGYPDTTHFQAKAIG